VSTHAPKPLIQTAEIVLPCAELDPTIAFFTGRLGFRLETIFPAEAPEVAVITGHGLRLRLARAASGTPATLRLACTEPDRIAEGTRLLIAPNGTRVEIVEAEPALILPPLVPEFVLSRHDDGAAWTAGRAGMGYRDLIPGRLSGRFIASHIRIAEAGPVADYVHYHKVRFQMIYCRAGWAQLVYEDQGPAFRLEAGDCVLQPPQIRHRVLESSAGLEVIEIGCPALHETWADHELTLPNTTFAPSREFGGQRFHRHIAATAHWQPWHVDGFERRDIGIAGATGGLAGAGVIRPAGAQATTFLGHDGEFLFLFVLDGQCQLDCGDRYIVAAGDAVAIPAGAAYALAECTPDLQLLEVTLPAR
jgi:quercetin dioxygenase-like cupin family protein